MYHIYILKSINSNHYYTGQTNNIESRILLHNAGRINWSKRYRPWKIVYTEEYSNRNEAVKREKYLKSHAGRNWIKIKIKGP